MTRSIVRGGAAVVFAAAALTGCNPLSPTAAPTSSTKPAAAETTSAAQGPEVEAPLSKEEREAITEARAKLSPEDRALVAAQEWCAISTKEHLGSMGEPIKLDVKGQPVFICCKGCKKKAEADPDKTLAQVAKLKEKAKAATKPTAN